MNHARSLLRGVTYRNRHGKVWRAMFSSLPANPHGKVDNSYITIETQSDTPPYVFLLAHYTIYANMCAKLLHVSARLSRNM
jgi:hypothetical protein